MISKDERQPACGEMYRGTYTAIMGGWKYEILFLGFVEKALTFDGARSRNLLVADEWELLSVMILVCTESDGNVEERECTFLLGGIAHQIFIDIGAF